jgi:tetratricopeptide (TPR) repeat protein
MRWLWILLFSWSLGVQAQDDLLAREYINSGAFEKALVIYKKLYEEKPTNSFYTSQLVSCYQQLEDYTSAENILKDRLKISQYPVNFVELGYNYQLQKDSLNAQKNYDKAISSINERANYSYGVGRKFQEYSLLDEAIKTYELAMQIEPALEFNMQLAAIYGEKGQIDQMFNSYLNFGLINESSRDAIKRFIGEFITENSDDTNNILLRKVLLKRIQSQPDLYWSDMLSWLFVQQKQYNKAFAQEKALYKRETQDVTRLVDLAETAKTDEVYDRSLEIFNYVIENAQSPALLLFANQRVLEIKTKTATTKDYEEISAIYESLLDTYGKTSESVDLTVSYAHFLAFYKNNTSKAISTLKQALDLKVSEPKKAEIKIELGDILVFEERFNEALIYYSQVQKTLKNSTLSQVARFKVAKASYYKGDFTWAESQLKVLKSSVSQLTANDALDLKLLISDNRQEDSLQVALTQYAKADLMAFQNKTVAAISLLETIKESQKTKSIIPQVLLKQAQLYEKQAQFEKAKVNYESLIATYKESILADDAIFALALLELNQLNNPEAAKKGFETIIFEHADSIYFTEARKKFRTLRGDTLQ